MVATMIYGGKGRYVFLFAPLFLIFYIISDGYNAHISFYTNHFLSFSQELVILSHDFGYMVVGSLVVDRDIFLFWRGFMGLVSYLAG